VIRAHSRRALRCEARQSAAPGSAALALPGRCAERRERRFPSGTEGESGWERAWREDDVGSSGPEGRGGLLVPEPILQEGELESPAGSRCGGMEAGSGRAAGALRAVVGVLAEDPTDTEGTSSVLGQSLAGLALDLPGELQGSSAPFAGCCECHDACFWWNTCSWKSWGYTVVHLLLPSLPDRPCDDCNRSALACAGRLLVRSPPIQCDFPPVPAIYVLDDPVDWVTLLPFP
jgi:hypothetical protein